MPFGCFGKRRKREKPDDLAAKNADTAVDGGGDDSAKTGNAVGEATTKLPNSDSEDVSEVIAVARHHSMYASAPSSVEHRHTTIGIQKSATLARYDFLRKSEYANTADRWVALKKQYLTPTMTNSQSQHHHTASGGQNGSVRRAAQSLPRQFAPPTLTGTPVRFSQWFYERQTKEAMARQEFHEREEKNRKILDGIVDNDPASIIETNENFIEANSKLEDAPAIGTTIAEAAESAPEQEPTGETTEADDGTDESADAEEAEKANDDNNPPEINSIIDDPVNAVKDAIGEVEEEDGVRDAGDTDTVEENNGAATKTQAGVPETD